MNRFLTGVLSKFFLYFVVGYVTLRAMDGNTVGWISIFALVGTVINYLFGDKYILPQYGNISACIIDGFMAGLTAYAIDLLYREFEVGILTLIILALLVAIGEYFFHLYIFKSENIKQ